MRTLKLQRNMQRADILTSGAIIAMLAFSFFGIQSAYAAITNQLDFGDRGEDVTELQTYFSTTPVIYPERLVTGYFGPLTQAAVRRYQTAHGIVSQGTPVTTGYGRVGPRTMASINAQLAGIDESAPLITGINISSGSTGASIGWTTNESARGKVYYDTSPIRVSNIYDVTGVFSGEPVVSGILAQYDGLERFAQAVNITGLSPNTTYYYLVVALDARNNVSVSLPSSFRTNQ